MSVFGGCGGLVNIQVHLVCTPGTYFSAYAAPDGLTTQNGGRKESTAQQADCHVDKQMFYDDDDLLSVVILAFSGNLIANADMVTVTIRLNVQLFFWIR